MADNISKQISKHAKRGPHRVLVGDLDYAGLTGKVYTPAEGKALPAVVFAHDWRKDIKAYHATLRHLASWGIVVAAPNTERGVEANHRGFASDIETSLQILTGVRLGAGKITVSPSKLGVVGHGMGAGCAVLSALGRGDQLQAVVAAFPSKVSPSAEQAAAKLTVPAMVIGSDTFPIFDYGNAPLLAHVWKQNAVYRELEGISHDDLVEKTTFKLFSNLGKAAHRRENIRGLITGYLLATLENDRKLSGFLDPDAEAKAMQSFSSVALQKKAHPEMS